uniref:Uncharacterized protein LOC108949782 n=1 Tax=Phallusia mammillata TaxID=59560 RepID=A0A6F9DJ88_9ASCI|nr:uncharacterized protein LOC108949782 [Phallusia mammillata]
MPRSKNPNPHKSSCVKDSLNQQEMDSYSPPDIDGSDYDDEQNMDSDQGTTDATINPEATLRVKTEMDESGGFTWSAAAANDANSSVDTATRQAMTDPLISSAFSISAVKSKGVSDLHHDIKDEGTHETEDSAVGQFSHMTMKRGTLVGKRTLRQKNDNKSKSKHIPFPILGNHNPNILNWFRDRFTFKEGKRLSASQVIKQYEKDFTNTADFPLINFQQVGHFLRRVFPTIERCKITHRGKRIWVYRNLCLAEENQSELNNEVSESISESSHKTDGGRLLSSVDVRRSTRVRRKKSYDNEFECTDDNGRMSQKRKSRSSGILYSLLYPPQSEIGTTDKQEGLLSASNGKRKLIHEELVLEWLRENYEYAEGFHVRSLDVLRRYNRCREIHVQHLCQVGRYIKMVFPQAKHMRKTTNGGKREWIYCNVRAKEEGEISTEPEWTPPPIEEEARPSMASTGIFSTKSPSLVTSAEAPTEQSESESFPPITLVSLPSELSSIYLDDDEKNDQQHLLAPSKTVSTISDTESFATVSSHLGQTRMTIAEQKNNHAHPTRRSHLESQIDRLRSTKSTFRPVRFQPERVVNAADRDDTSTGDNHTRLGATPKIGKLWSIKTDVPARKIENSKRVPVVPNRWITTKRKISQDGKGPSQPPGKLSIIKVSLGNNKSKTQSSNESVVSSSSNQPSKPFTQDIYQIHNERLLLNPQANSNASAAKAVQLCLPELETYKSHWSGWAFTPTRPTTEKQDYFEWVLFEGNMLCNGQRVFRELRIYDDWSVSIHVLGRKVYADEVGGITDLKRTRASIDKVMQTLADAKLCRGFASPRLSEMKVHGVIVAKPEVWSKRLADNEELRHRAINCQVLHRTSNECCSKCTRIIQVNKQKHVGLSNLMS